MSHSKNCLWGVVRKSFPMLLIVNAVAMAIAYSFYEIAFRVSLVPFRMAVVVLMLTVTGPSIIALIDGGKSRLVALGFSNLITLVAIYFFFGVVSFFFYFLFAPMPTYMHVGGLALGLAMTGYWMAITARDVNRALATSRFVEDAFEDTGSVLQYRLQNMAKLEAVLSSRSPFSKGYMYMVLLIGPLSLVSGRLLTPVFGPHGPILLGALILFPVSQWIAGIATRQYIAMVRLPRMLERTRGKPVIAVSDEGR